MVIIEYTKMIRGGTRYIKRTSYDEEESDEFLKKIRKDPRCYNIKVERK